MRKFRPWLAALTALALLGLAGSFTVAAVMSSGARLVQLIEPDESGAASLFGDAPPSGPAGTRLGSPQLVVIRDEQAFLDGTGAAGERFVNAKHLRETGQYPLQVKTITFFRDIIALVSGLATLAFGAAWWWMGRSSMRLT